MKPSISLNFIDIPNTNMRSYHSNEENEKNNGDDGNNNEEDETNNEEDDYVEERNYPPVKSTTDNGMIRRNFLFRNNNPIIRREGYSQREKDADIKMKISTLVEQTVHDTDRRIKSINHIKKRYRENAPYKAGFIFSMIKKARDVLNELFNVAVHHKDEWKTLEQLKIFELIVHTNVDTTNLVRQLVEIHIQFLNTTSSTGGGDASGRKRVVLLK
ncbi:unnamed protein product [Diatraea saccharalis]|uniref:Uncharacterized protein n=1 Tax=Diatraea saccharalis TaxID=40085 RepID=A0A9N9RD90_9NEOP|nr:unnamed protein product [Diatraea saccharalis]